MFYFNDSVDRNGIRTHATVVTGTWNQRLRPLGHSAMNFFHNVFFNEKNIEIVYKVFPANTLIWYYTLAWLGLRKKVKSKFFFFQIWKVFKAI